MPALELSPLQAQFMPDISSLWCVNRISTYTEQIPVVILLFMSWSISCREALIQILNLQRSQPGVYYLCISKEHSSAIRSEMQSTPELLLLNVFTDPKRILKPFLIANTITTVPTAILFASNKRMMWHGHALSPEFTEKFSKLIRQSHIKVYNEDALLFKTLRSSSCRSISARRSPTGNSNASLMTSLLTNKASPGDISEESSTLQKEYCTKAHSPLTRSTLLNRSKQRPSSVQRANQLIQSATHDMLAANVRENDLAVSSPTNKQLPQSSYPTERMVATSALWKTLSPPKIYAQRAPISDNAKKYLIRSPKKERADPLQPLRSPTSIIRAELSEVTGEESSYPLVEEGLGQSFFKSKILHRSSAVAESVKEELGWMLMKQDSILPKPLRVPESFPADVLRDSEGTQQLFNKSAIFLRRMNV